jgi:hypothetical protein
MARRIAIFWTTFDVNDSGNNNHDQAIFFGLVTGGRWRRWPPVWRVAVNVLNKQSWAADSLGVRRGLTVPQSKELLCYKLLQGLRWVLSNDRSNRLKMLG